MKKVKLIIKMEENYAQKRRRLFGKQFLPKYLTELNRLVLYKVEENDLLSIVETDAFIESYKTLYKKPVFFQKKIEFSEKKLLKELIDNNVLEKDALFMMYLSYSLDCGLMKLRSLNDFNFDFSFYDEHAGIIILLRADKKERILLDYGEEDGAIMLELEICR